ncbi:uncharacterized protein LOC111074761 [Drosophila obscura]|uniref:uncharacterized protein LOC111074761 n=1 Tax=Drosophila obscura TaxID=7282 RepID=UPI001BB21D5F|nr:uncharacterized protein LOC111074761 [Drosophila obscura]
MKLVCVLLLCVLAIACLPDVSPAKHHKHQRHHDDDEHHYLPPSEEKEELEQPFYKKEKHTSERVVYHKEEEHDEEPKKERVDHYHHYDKKPQVKTEHIHYKHDKPHVRTDHSGDLFTPAATQVVYRRRRPHRVTYASAPNSVFHTHTQINVQSQDSELNSLIRPDPPGGQQLPAGAQASTGAQAPTGAGFLPNCQFTGIPGNNPPGCGPSDPLGAQLPASALAPGAGLPANPGALPIPAGGQLAVQGNGQRPQKPSRPGGGYGRNNFFFDPSLAAQLGAAGFPAVGGAQLAAGQGAPNQNQFDPSFGAQLGASGQAAGAAGGPFDPSFGAAAQRPAGAQAPIAAYAPFQNQFDPNAQLGGQLNAAQQPNQFGNPALGAQLGAGQAPLQNQFDPTLGAQLGTGQRPNAPLGAQLGAAQAPLQNQFDPALGAQLAAGQVVPRLRSGRPRNRSNYQGLNVLNGNVFGQPHLQGPTNALGNQQDTNIIDGNFYSDPSVHHGHGHHRALVSVNGNQRSVLVADDDDYVDDDTDPTFPLGFAASNPQASYVVAPKKGSKSSFNRRSSTKDNDFDLGAAASEYDTDYREDGYHYKKPKHSFEF